MKSIITKSVCGLLSILLIMVAAGCSEQSKKTQPAQPTQPTQNTAETLATDVKNELDKMFSDNEFSGVAQITRGGKVIYQYIKGNDDNGKPLTIDASLPIGSVSKQFCAACVMLLCEQKKLSVDDTLDKYFPNYKYGKKMTVRQVLNMSAGLGDYLEKLDPSAVTATEEENVRLIKQLIFDEELHYEPGDDYEYSNSGYFLLANIVEQASGIAYHKFLREQFFEPLGMSHTGFTEEIFDDHDWTFALNKADLKKEFFYNPGMTKGAGDVVSNAKDMEKWMRGLSSGKVISSDSFRQMTENVNPNSTEDYGYGLVHMAYDGVGHEGQIPPHFGAVDYLNTKRDMYVFVAANNPRGMSFVMEIPKQMPDILFKATPHN